MNPAEFVYCVLLKPPLLRKAANFFLRAILPRKTRVRGAVVFLNPRDPVVSGGLRLGVYEQDEIGYFCEHFKPGMTFVDVGANVGLYTALAIHKGAGRILAVEPFHEALGFLEQTIAANHPSCPVHIAACAAGPRQEMRPFFTNPDNRGDNRLHSDPMLVNHGEVPVETLDSLCLKQGIKHIDFLKIDVQGSEMLVLKGALRMLQNSPDCRIMTEFWPDGIRRCGSDPLAYLHLLTSSGRTLSILQGGRLFPAQPDDLTEQTVGRQYRNLVIGPASNHP
jgi:FkbM family methyltransferase